jgi:hypothetical protein
MVSKNKWFNHVRGIGLVVALALATPALWAATASAQEPIVGLWQVTETDPVSGAVDDHVYEQFNSDQSELENAAKPILTGNVCLGTWIKLGKNHYGLAHPVFGFQDVNSNGEGSTSTLGQSDGSSGVENLQVTVSKDKNSFSGKSVVTIVEGFDPFASGATVLVSLKFNITGKRVTVDKSLLPE